MKDGYVFYCSRCRIDHAGECPPEKAVTMISYSFNLPTPRKAVIIPNLLTNTGTINLNTGRPVIGSLYLSETRKSPTDKWTLANGDFEVMSVTGAAVEIKHVYSSNRWTYADVHWNIDGAPSPGNPSTTFDSR